LKTDEIKNRGWRVRKIEASEKVIQNCNGAYEL
jgi:hypothetical protein